MASWRDSDAYEPDDPKHPDWEALAADRADMERKRAKEDGPWPEIAKMEEHWQVPFEDSCPTWPNPDDPALD